MPTKVLRVRRCNDQWDTLIPLDKILQVYKVGNGIEQVTIVQLITGDKVQTYDSLNTIEARMNSDD